MGTYAKAAQLRASCPRQQNPLTFAHTTEWLSTNNSLLVISLPARMRQAPAHQADDVEVGGSVAAGLDRLRNVIGRVNHPASTSAMRFETVRRAF